MDVSALRSAHGWSQRELAEKLKVSQTLVAQWERGASKPTSDQDEALSWLERKNQTVVRMDSYPSAPPGGRKGSREAEERQAWVRARNRWISRGVAKGPNPGPVTG